RPTAPPQRAGQNRLGGSFPEWNDLEAEVPVTTPRPGGIGDASGHLRMRGLRTQQHQDAGSRQTILAIQQGVVDEHVVALALVGRRLEVDVDDLAQRVAQTEHHVRRRRDRGHRAHAGLAEALVNGAWATSLVPWRTSPSCSGCSLALLPPLSSLDVAGDAKAN